MATAACKYSPYNIQAAACALSGTTFLRCNPLTTWPDATTAMVAHIVVTRHGIIGVDGWR
jgi:hypothetical protein